jgi:hypothetical protein
VTVLPLATRNSYPVGETWLFDIGVATIEQRYDSINSMHYRIASGSRAGFEETVAIDVHLIRPDVFLVSWQEADGVTVVHVEDFSDNTFYSNATLIDGRFMRVRGSMRRVV